MSRPRLAIIGLDCAEPSLVFGGLAGRLPHLENLMRAGRWGRLQSSDPPITVPAWACLVTGRDPGQLGLYGFRNRRGPGYDDLGLASAQDLKAPAIWDLAGGAGLTSVLLGVPLTYPPRQIRGAMVAGFPTPPGAPLAWPRSLGPRLAAWAGGPYLPDIEGFRQLAPQALLEQAALMARRRFAVARGLQAQYQPEFFMMVEMGPDRVQHACWGLGNGASGGVAGHYRLLDSLLGGLLAGLEPQTLVLVVSDHGAQAMRGGLAINEWLIREGWLRLKARPQAPRRLSPEMVDWPATRAWSDGGHYARIFLNLAGREPQGALPPAQAAAAKAELRAGLEALAGPDGAPLGNMVLDPRDLYRELRGLPPDLLVYPGGLAWRAVGTVQPMDGAPVLVQDNDTGPDRANHAPQGILIAARAGGRPLARAGREVEGASLYDVFPSALRWLGLDPPPAGPGRAWEWLC